MMLKEALFFQVIFVTKEANPCSWNLLLRNLLNHLLLTIILFLLILMRHLLVNGWVLFYFLLCFHGRMV